MIASVIASNTPAGTFCPASARTLAAVIVPVTVAVGLGVVVQVGVIPATDAGAGFAVVWHSQTTMPPESRDLPKWI